MSDRLDFLLCRAGLGTRKEVRGLIAKGRVAVRGEVVRDHGAKLEPGDDNYGLVVAGQPVAVPPTVLHLLLHKPMGQSCSHDPREVPLVYDLLPSLWQRAGVQSAGRLDRHTTGLLFLTTDGQLLHRLTDPRRQHPKRYRIGYSGTLAADAVARVAAGMILPEDPDQPTRPAQLTLEGPGRATLILHEGRFHQVRRMIAALGGEVDALHRDRVGGLDLPADLAPGQVREATAAELAAMVTTPGA